MGIHSRCGRLSPPSRLRSRSPKRRGPPGPSRRSPRGGPPGPSRRGGPPGPSRRGPAPAPPPKRRSPAPPPPAPRRSPPKPPPPRRSPRSPRCVRSSRSPKRSIIFSSLPKSATHAGIRRRLDRSSESVWGCWGVLDSASDIRSGAWAGKGRDDEQDAALVSYFIRAWQTLKTWYAKLDRRAPFRSS